MQALLDKQWPKKETKGCHDQEVSDQDKHILSYIGGAMVSKLSRHYGVSEKQACIKLLACDSQDPCAAYVRVTKMKDRGGLVYMREKACEVMEHLEVIYRTHDDSFENFSTACSSTLESKFLQCIADSGEDLSFSDETLSIILHDFCKLFFKIRKHHSVKILAQSHSQKGQKGLRGALKKS